MNTSQTPASKHLHPLLGVGCWLLAPRAETETRTRAGDYSDTCHTPPKVVGIAGGATSSPSRQRNKPLSGRMGNGLGYPDRDARTGLFPVAPCALNADSGVAQRVERRFRRSQGQSLPSASAFTYSQRVTSAPHFLSATGAASLRMPPFLPVETRAVFKLRRADNSPAGNRWPGLFAGVA